MTFCIRCCCLHSAFKRKTKAFSIQIKQLFAVTKLFKTSNSTLWNPSRTSAFSKSCSTSVFHSLLPPRTSILSPLLVICSCCLFTFFLTQSLKLFRELPWWPKLRLSLESIYDRTIYLWGWKLCISLSIGAL